MVNYKLCDRHLDCESCEFDQVMRGMVAPHHLPGHETDTALSARDSGNPVQQLIDRYLTALFNGCQIHLDRYYHRSHFWYKPENSQTVQVGMDKLLLRTLEPVERVILPESGETYYKGQLMAWIIRGEQALALYAPHKCTVTEINPNFLAGGIAQAMSEDAYLFKITGENPVADIRQMCGNMRGLHNYTRKIEIIKNYLKKSFRENVPENVGLTYADGGSIQTSLEKVIGEQAFQSLVDELFDNRSAT